MSDAVREKIAIVIGSDSDFKFIEAGVSVLKEFNIEHEVFVRSAHWAHKNAADFAKESEKNGFDIIISAAGKASFLPSFLAAYTTIPVIGLVVKNMDEDNSFPSTMGKLPSGLPIATVVDNSSESAALLAIQIYSLSNNKLKAKLYKYRSSIEKKVIFKEFSLER